MNIGVAAVLFFRMRVAVLAVATLICIVAAQCAFPAMAALCGVLGGYQFCSAVQIYLPCDSRRSKVGMLYAIDLLGGCAGALLLSAYLIPVFGF